jgi:hypothetical protein
MAELAETLINLQSLKGSVALATVAVAIIGFTTVAPAKADYDDWRWRRNWHEREWRERDWREHHRHAYGY